MGFKNRYFQRTKEKISSLKKKIIGHELRITILIYFYEALSFEVYFSLMKIQDKKISKNL